jgi:hypothetical protein
MVDELDENKLLHTNRKGLTTKQLEVKQKALDFDMRLSKSSFKKSQDMKARTGNFSTSTHSFTNTAINKKLPSIITKSFYREDVKSQSELVFPERYVKPGVQFNQNILNQNRRVGMKEAKISEHHFRRSLKVKDFAKRMRMISSKAEKSSNDLYDGRIIDTELMAKSLAVFKYNL